MTHCFYVFALLFTCNIFEKNDKFTEHSIDFSNVFQFLFRAIVISNHLLLIKTQML